VRVVGRSAAVSGIDLALGQDPITIGSARDNTIVVDSPEVGSHHLVLRRRGAECILQPLDAEHPVFLNGIRVVGRHVLLPGDLLEVGPAAFSLVSASANDAERPREDAGNRRLWLGASVGVLVALVALIVALASGFAPAWSLQALELALAPTNTAMPTPPATAAPAQPVTPTFVPATPVVTPIAAATPTATIEPSRATIEAVLAAAPHVRVVAAMTAVAILSPEERERALADLASGTPEVWLELVLSTPTPAPPSGTLVLGRYLADANRYDIVLHDLYTGGETQLLPQASQPAFSRDGRLLAYHSWQESALGLFAATSDGTQRWLLTRDAHSEDVWPAWAPDGSAVAFASTRLGDGMSRVYTVPSQGGIASDVTYGEYVDWSPDGSQLAVKSCIGGTCGIMLVRPDGSELVPLTTEASDGAPAWSPNGRYIAFHSHRLGKWAIYVMRSDGGGLLQLTGGSADDCVPVWSPDGRYLAFRSDRSGDWAIWAVPATGGEPLWLFDAPARPGEELVERLSWLP